MEDIGGVNKSIGDDVKHVGNVFLNGSSVGLAVYPHVILCEGW